jgi:hypothetical protein
MKTDPERLYKAIHELVEIGERDADLYFETVHAIALIFPRDLREQLTQLVKGPVWDGDVISKTHRGRLFAMGLAIRVCCKGEPGYTGATYFAFSVLKKLNQIIAGESEQAATDRSGPVDLQTLTPLAQ